jgi:NADH-quinone oxidoreductase subunit B
MRGNQAVPVSVQNADPVRLTLDWGRRYALWVFNVGLACCAVEAVAAGMGDADVTRLGVMPFAPGPEQADVLVIAGTVTDAMAPGIRQLYDSLPARPYVLSFGACANCGGPYWDSYAVTKGIDQLIPVDIYVPGCPPRPQALLHGLARLHEQISARSPAPSPPRDATALTAAPVRPPH